jgi:uncharacterized protein DUF2589
VALKPLTFEQLVSAPLRGLVLGQEAATQATADFISKLGFDDGAPGGVPAARTLEFDYVHPVPDPANPGSTIDTPTRLRVPLLTLLSVPSLRIAEAHVSFGAHIVGTRSVKTPRAAVRLDSERAAAGVSTQLLATYAPAAPAPGEPPPTVTVDITVERERPSEGLARILSALADSITAAPAAAEK